MTEMSKPTEAHRKLDCFAGHWTGQERMFPSPWDLQGSTAVGRCNNRVAVDGFVIVHDYEQEREGAINFHGHGVFTYGTAEKSYVLYWWDSMGMATNVFKGNFEGNTLRMLCQEAHGISRGTWDFLDASHYRFRMEMSTDGQKWMTLIEADYTRGD